MKTVDGGVTTYLPNQYFSATATSTTKHIFALGLPVATIDKTQATSGGTSTSTPTLLQSAVDTMNAFVTLPSPVTTGNLIVIGLTVYTTATIPTNAITDNKGNTYTKVNEANNANDRTAIFYAANVTGGTNVTISASTGGSIAAHEYSGVATSSPLDKNNKATGTSNTPSSGSVTTTLGNELYFGVAWSMTHNDSWTPGSGYTLRQQVIANDTVERLASEDKVGTAQTTAATFTTGTSAAWGAAIATFKPLVTQSGGGSTSTTTIHYIQTDHLGSTHLVTDQSGTISEATDYYAYGAPRIDAKSGSYTGEQRKYIGQYYDASSQLSYLNARYYDSQRGQFLSEDPIFWGDPKGQILSDPLSLNTYSYSANNPIVKSDPNGKQFCEDACIGEIIAARAMQWAIPVARTALTTGLVSTDAQIGSNLYQQVTGNGQNSMTVGSLGNAFGQGFAFGAVAETGAGLVSPLAAPFFRTARTAKMFGQTVSAGAVTIGADSVNGSSNPWQIAGDTTFSMASTYGAARVIGLPRGADVKSFSSPLFFNGSQMSNASRSALASQVIQSALMSIVSALQTLLVSLQPQQSNSKSK